MMATVARLFTKAISLSGILVFELAKFSRVIGPSAAASWSFSLSKTEAPTLTGGAIPSLDANAKVGTVPTGPPGLASRFAPVTSLVPLTVYASLASTVSWPFWADSVDGVRSLSVAASLMLGGAIGGTPLSAELSPSCYSVTIGPSNTAVEDVLIFW